MNKHTRRCCVLNCRNSNYTILSKTKTKLYKFPQNGNRCRDWLRAIGDPGVASCTWETLITHGYVCRDHFEEKYVTAIQEITVNAVPTIFPDLRIPLSNSQLRLFDESVPVQNSLLGFDYYERVGSHAKNSTMNPNPIMNNILVEAESIIKLEEVNFELLKGVKVDSHAEEPIMNQNPIMGDIVVEAESIIKLEEIKEEPNDFADESPWNFLALIALEEYHSTFEFFLEFILRTALSTCHTLLSAADNTDKKNAKYNSVFTGAISRFKRESTISCRRDSVTDKTNS